MEEYVEVPSDCGITFNVKPKMKALEIAEKVRVNLPNSDLVGHTGDIEATVVACKVADEVVKRRRNPCCFNTGEMKKPGNMISKGHKNYDLMLNLQLGIRYSVGKPTILQMRDLRPRGFDPREKFWTRFPPEGSKVTPPHSSVEFRWKDYYPMVFRHLRKLFSVDAADYMLAICGSDALRELSSPGKSGSFFYVTHDDRFMIKTEEV